MNFDVVVIGAGPGGYVGAIRCSQLGLKTLIIERQETLGGTCLNVGCIPTKTLLELSGHYFTAKTHYKKFGIRLDNLSLDYPRMLQRKENVINQNGKGIRSLLDKNAVTVLTGHASFKNDQAIEVLEENGNRLSVSAKHFIIATGAKAFTLPFAEIDKDRILTSTEILSLDRIPGSLVIAGAGVIGLEIGTHFARLGTKVDILDIADSILPNFDKGLSGELMRSLKKLGIKFHLSCNIKQVSNKGESVAVVAHDSKTNDLLFESDYCLLAVGRSPDLKNLGLENTAVKIGDHGTIMVNGQLQTSVNHIYAIGDVIGGMMLAHKASEEGVIAAESIAGKTRKLNYKAIPSVVYTSPETASVGYTEEELIVEGIDYKVGTCQNRVLGRAHTADKLDGFAKVLVSAKTGVILGVHLVAPHASEMIGEAVVAIEQRLTAEQLAGFSHAHPTYLEALKEACLMASEGKAIHAM
ncbi:dihydrolipoyl dehydrogenase [bacterium]|nr:dihydrolipoyl dehydrogenase [bacterium]